MNRSIYCTSMSFSSDYNNSIRASVDFVCDDLKLLRQLFQPGHIGFSGIQDRQEEFLCLWCGTPNPIKHVVCSRCGAPRGVLIE